MRRRLTISLCSALLMMAMGAWALPNHGKPVSYLQTSSCYTDGNSVVMDAVPQTEWFYVRAPYILL